MSINNDSSKNNHTAVHLHMASLSNQAILHLQSNATEKSSCRDMERATFSRIYIFMFSRVHKRKATGEGFTFKMIIVLSWERISLYLSLSFFCYNVKEKQTNTVRKIATLQGNKVQYNLPHNVTHTHLTPLVASFRFFQIPLHGDKSHRFRFCVLFNV